MDETFQFVNPGGDLLLHIALYEGLLSYGRSQVFFPFLSDGNLGSIEEGCSFILIFFLHNEPSFGCIQKAAIVWANVGKTAPLFS